MIHATRWTCLLVSSCVLACADRSNGAAPTNTPTATAPTAAPTTPPSVDDEYEQLKRATPVDACALLTSEKLKAILPDQTFTVHEQLAPRLSGYVWDARCTQWAGAPAGAHAPTHSVTVLAATAANEARAKRNLAQRQETAASATGYRAQPELGPSAYSIVGTGSARVFFVKGQTELQVNVSFLQATDDERLAKALTLARSL